MKSLILKSILVIISTMILSSCWDKVTRLATNDWKSLSKENYYILIPNDWKENSIGTLLWADFYLDWPVNSNNDWPTVLLNIQRNQYTGGDFDWNDTIEYVKKDFELGYNTKMIRAEKQSYNGKDYVYTEFKVKSKSSKELNHFISYTYILPGKTYVLGFSVPESIFSSEYRNLWETILGTFSLKK